MSLQTESQKIGSLGQTLVEQQIRRSNFWIARNLTEDFGIDLEMEHTNCYVTGKFIKVQIKSHRNVVLRGDFISQYLPTAFLRYSYECRVPIIIVIVSIADNKSWFLWLQKWLIETGNFVNIYGTQKSLKVNFHHSSADFQTALDNEIISIATWENSTQLHIALKDLANLSLKLFDYDLAELLFNYIGKYNTQNSNLFDSILEKIIDLGSNIWATPEGNKASQLLYKFIRENGNMLNAVHISKLVMRGKDCSRTGLNALGVLYDNFPQHTLSLNLPRKFKKFHDPRLHYFCTIRERYINLRSPGWLDNNLDLTVGKLSADFTSVNTSIFDKWANRGDSVIFDYVYKI